MDLFEIAESWYRVAKHTPAQKALADERLKVCNDCDQKAFVEELKYFKCNGCGCPLKAKVYSSRGPSACPKAKWLQ